MKKTLLLIFISIISGSLYALDLSQDTLQGQWLITKVGDMDTKEMDLGEDIWIFKGNKMMVKSSGVSMKLDEFSIKGNKIDFGTHSIEVTEFSADKMTTDTMGMIQVLERIK